MSNELVPVEPAFEAEIYDAGIDVIVEETYVDVLPEGEPPVSTPLGQADEEALAQGIVSVFESLRSDAGEDDAGEEDAGDAIADAGDDDPTIVLLAELNRLWAEPLAA